MILLKNCLKPPVFALRPKGAEDQTRRKSAAPEPEDWKWRNLWLCKDNTSFWGEEKDTEQDCLTDRAAWLDGAKEIEAKDNGLTTCVFFGDVVPETAPMIRRRILNYIVIPVPVKIRYCPYR